MHKSLENLLVFVWIVALSVYIVDWYLFRRNKRLQDGIVIAVMGVTGAGKSSFVKSVTGRSDIVVGHDLLSETRETKAYTFLYAGIQFTLVDTPGFDDSGGSDTEIMQSILSWLKISYGEGTRLNGIVYLHRICDPRMPGSAMSNLRMFRSLCGADNFANVVLATTFWGLVDERLGAKRERELQQNADYWGQMIEKGSKVVRLKQDQESNLALLMQIANQNGKMTVDAQREMLAGKSPMETSAAKQVFVSTEVDDWKREQQIEIEAERRRLQKELEEASVRKKALLAREAAIQRERQQAANRKAASYQKEVLERQRREDEAREVESRKRQHELALQHKKIAELEQQKEREAKLRQARERLVEERQKSYRLYECKQVFAAATRCAKCATRLRVRYYHCCFCNNDSYNQCLRCGAICRDRNHPVMKYRDVFGDAVEGYERRRGFFAEVRSIVDEF